MNCEDRSKIIHAYISCYNDFDIDGMLELFHEDIEFTHISDNDVSVSTRGIEELGALAQQARTLFTFRRQTLREIEHFSDKTVVYISFAGVVAIDLPNGVKKGETLKLEGISEFRFRDDKISQLIDIS